VRHSVYTTLKFLGFQGAPYIYDISGLRVNDGRTDMKEITSDC
jgi:hypothetical protein